MMDFSKHKLQNYLKEDALAQQNANVAIKNATDSSGMRNKNREAIRQRDQKNTTQQMEDEIRIKKQQIKMYEAQKSDWRSDLQEKVIDGNEREKHPYVTVMPTGDENIIQAIEQLGKKVKDKKDEVKEEVEELEEAEKRIKAKGSDRSKKIIPNAGPAYYKQAKDHVKYEEVEPEELEEKKKKCKDGYTYNEKTKQCEKRKKGKSSSSRYGIGIGLYPHHHHDDDKDDDNDSGGDSGGDGGDGGGGGMGEMFDHLGDMLIQEMTTKEQMALMKKINQAKKPKDFDPDARKKQRGAQVKQMVKNDMRTKNEKETQGRYK